MFKNAIIFECFTAPPEPTELTQAASQRISRPLAGPEAKRTGWAPVPCLDDQSLVYHAGGAGITLMNLEILERDLKPKHVREVVEQKAEAIRRDSGRRVSRQEKAVIKEEVYEQLLPRAFVNRRQSRVAWVYSATAGINYIIVDESTRSVAEAAIDLLRETLGSLQVRPLFPGNNAVSPRSMMTNALRAWGGPNAADGLPKAAHLGESCKMVDPSQQSTSVTFKETGLLKEEVREALTAGYQVSDLEMVFTQHLTATLTDSLQLKRIRYADDVQERMHDAEEWLAGCIISVNAIVTVMTDVLAMHQVRG